MNFAERMALIQSLEPDLVSELSPTNLEEAKEQFLTDTTLARPAFVYGNAREHLVEEEIARVLPAAFDRAGYEEMACRDILMLAVQRLHMQLSLLSAIEDSRENFDSNLLEAQEFSQEIWSYNTVLYGKINEDIFYALLEQQLAKTSKHSLLSREMVLVEEMRGWLESPEAQNRNAAVFVPKPETVQQFGELCRQKMAKSLDRVPMDRDELTADEVCRLVNTILQEDFPYPVEFRAVINEQLKSINVNQHKGTIELPRQRGIGPYTPCVVREIVIGHEVMTHVARTIFAQAHIPDLAVPLPGYGEFEEGVAKAVEQALNGNYQGPNTDHYLAIGMAVCKNLSFREVFDRQCALNLLIKVKPTDTEAEVRRKAAKVQNTAFTRTTRCFRGTGRVPLTKDLVYYNGQMRAWHYIENRIDEPEKLWRMLFESGKTDPTNSLHQELMLALGWQPADFEVSH